MTTLEDCTTIPGKSWTAAEDQIVAGHGPVSAIVTMLREAGYPRSYNAVSGRRHRLRERGNPIPDGRERDPERVRNIITDYCNGADVTAVAARYGVTPKTVYNKLRAAGVPLRTAGRIAAARANNAARARTTGHRQAVAAAAVLTTAPPADPITERVLQLRVQHPDRSTRELGALAGLTKDAYAARLRRALRDKHNVEHQQPPT
jgi:hypothetical protein